MSFLKRIEDGFLRLQFTGKDRLRLYRKLSRFLANGVKLPSALQTMWNHASNDGKRPTRVHAVVLAAWKKGVDEGRSFGVAIQDWVPQSDRVVIEAGDKAGNLSDALENACYLNEGQREIRAAVVAGVAYPIVLVAMAIFFMFIFGTQVIPAFEEILPRDRWTGFGAQMATMSSFVENGLVQTLIVSGVLIVFMLWTMPRWTGRLRTFVDPFPPYSIYRLIIGSGFLLSVAALVRAGVKVTSVLNILMRGASPWYTERLSRTLQLVNNGADIGDALYRSGYNFPDKDTVNDLRSYAKLEGFETMLQLLGRQNLEDSVQKIKAQSVILRNVGIVVLGGVFMWCVLGIFDLMNQVQSAI